MQDFFRDLLLRALLVALVSALVSGGVVWFVVDQSLRSIEVAIQTTNERIDDVKTDISGVKSDTEKIDLVLAQILTEIGALREASIKRNFENLEADRRVVRRLQSIVDVMRDTIAALCDVRQAHSRCSGLNESHLRLTEEITALSTSISAN
ncbi:MAG: hypothetical protein AAGI34_03625 [Pseudomonadota bacterium]